VGAFVSPHHSFLSDARRIHERLERLNRARVARQERDREGSSESVNGRPYSNPIGHPEHGLPDDLVRTLGSTDGTGPPVRNHIVVGPALDLTGFLGDRRIAWSSCGMGFTETLLPFSLKRMVPRLDRRRATAAGLRNHASDRGTRAPTCIPARWPRRGLRLICLRPGVIPGRDAWLDAPSEVRLDPIARI
jgi:hypothetical protein